MFNNDTELLFPSRIISSLRTLRGEPWGHLIDEVTAQGAESAAYVAFVLMMARLSSCITCNADSFRAMRGCTQCAHQTVHRLHNSDEELVELYRLTLQEVEKYISAKSAERVRAVNSISGVTKRD